VGRAERAVKWARRRPAAALVAVVALATLLLVGGWVGFTLQLDQAWRDALEAKDDADEQRGRAEDALRESKVVSANLALDRGLALCDQGDVGSGMLSFVRGLELAPDDEGPLRAVLRANLAAWRGQLSAALLARWEPRLGERSDGLQAVAVSPDGKTALLGGQLPAAWLWDLKTGRQIGPPLPPTR
jgi:hypothetical protein